MSTAFNDHGLAGRLKGALSHAYILAGGSAQGREQAAVYLSAAAFCQGENAPCGRCAHCRKLLSGIHPDLHWLEREKDARQIVVDQIRALQAAVYILPNEAEKCVFAVKDAHLMNPNAQNALLKVFEEPPKHALILLLTDNAGALLPTLRSRAVTLRLAGDERADIPEQAAELLHLLEQGKRVEAAALCLKLDKLEREELPGFLTALQRGSVAALKEGRGLPPERAGELLRLLDEIVSSLEFNVGAGHIAGALAAFAAKA